MQTSPLQVAPSAARRPAPTVSDVTSGHVLTITGLDPIVAAQPLLQQLAERSSQPGAADYLHHFLTQPYMGGKVPHLLLLTTEPARTVQDLPASHLLGAVLLHQYRVARVRLPIFVTEDLAG